MEAVGLILIAVGAGLMFGWLAMKLVPKDDLPPRPDPDGHVEVFRPIDIPLPPKEEFHEVPEYPGDPERKEES